MLFQRFSEPDQPLKSRFRSWRVAKINVLQVIENHWFRIDFHQNLHHFWRDFGINFHTFWHRFVCLFLLHFYWILGPKRAPKWDQKVIKKVEKSGTGPKSVTLNLQGLRFGTTWAAQDTIWASIWSAGGAILAPVALPRLVFRSNFAAQDDTCYVF